MKMSSKAVIFVCLLFAFVVITSANVINYDKVDTISDNKADAVKDASTYHIRRVVRRSADDTGACCNPCRSGCTCCYA